MNQHLEAIHRTAELFEKYSHAVRVLQYDLETICPKEGMEEQGETIAFFGNEAYKLMKTEEFMAEVEAAYQEMDESWDSFDRALVRELYQSQLKNSKITPEMNLEFSRITQKAFTAWSRAKEAADFSLFAEPLAKVTDMERTIASLRSEVPQLKQETPYDYRLDDYEEGMTVADLDRIFGECKERLIPLLQKIQASPKKIRTDFMSREVTEEQQKKLAYKVLHFMNYDLNRGAMTTSEHPFTSEMARNDVRITTHYYNDAFASSLYSVIHEGGHGLFELNAPQENWEHHLNNKTMGQHESVSRFYENIIGRSEAFTNVLYDMVAECMPQVVEGVSKKEFYEALNTVTPSLIRTESDEFTYTFHVIIRYEIEKEIMNNGLDVAEIPALWEKKYKEYLGVTPSNDREGCLQDMHWTDGYGYFPTYALGNMYNAMYYNRMKEEVDIEAAIQSGSLAAVNAWMQEHVWKKADRQTPKEWIMEITGRELTPKDFLDYIEAKYTKIYEL
ncbi:MAG: carboxypeptidase M32 [Lachnospiraceae bacterium]|nr:carboxypeptidase M32 [Lachnospiraceae bacterium]